MQEIAAKPQPATKVAEEETDYLILVPPDYTPQIQMDFHKVED